MRHIPRWPNSRSRLILTSSRTEFWTVLGHCMWFPRGCRPHRVFASCPCGHYRLHPTNSRFVKSSLLNRIVCDPFRIQPPQIMIAMQSAPAFQGNVSRLSRDPLCRHAQPARESNTIQFIDQIRRRYSLKTDRCTAQLPYRSLFKNWQVWGFRPS